MDQDHRSQKRNCQISCFVNMPRSIEDVTSEHVRRFYGGIRPDEFSVFDKKLIASIMKVNNAYNEDMKKRKYSVLVSTTEGETLFTQKTPIVTTKQSIKEPKSDIRRCQHLKKDGCICNCIIKVKQAQFCGTHSRKKTLV